MSQSLYRKYRPMTFADVVDQNHIRITLQHELQRDKIAHAYLFAGPRGVGKTTLARLVAKAVNCEKRKKGEYEPCNECASCTDITSGRSLDVVEIDAASHTGVDMVREAIIENVRFVPHRSTYKVYIIDEVHMLSLSAFNALLKTLEEPPSHVLFVLATTELHKVPETIISRCQRFDFHRVSFDEVEGLLKKIAALEKQSVDDDVLATIAARSEGFVRDAVNLLDQVFALGKKHYASKDVEAVLPSSDTKHVEGYCNALLEYNAHEAIEVVNTAVDEGRDLETFTQDVLQWFRRMLLLKLGGATTPLGAYSREVDERMRSKLDSVDPIRIVRALEALSEALVEIKSAYIPQLPLELVAVEMSQLPSGNAPEPAREVESEKNKRPKGPSAQSPAGAQKIDAQVIASSSGNVTLALDLDTVRKKWPEVLQACKDNHSLQLLLKVMYPVNVVGGSVELGCEYEFHKTKLEDNKNRQIIEQVFAQVFGGTVFVKAVQLAAEKLKAAHDAVAHFMHTPVPQPAKAVDPEIQTLLKEFGGKVVE